MIAPVWHFLQPVYQTGGLLTFETFAVLSLNCIVWYLILYLGAAAPMFRKVTRLGIVCHSKKHLDEWEGERHMYNHCAVREGTAMVAKLRM